MLDLRGKKGLAAEAVRQMTRAATPSQIFSFLDVPWLGVSASRTAVDEGFDQCLKALGWLIATRQDGDVDQWHEESDKDHPGVRDYVHVLLPPTTKAALRWEVRLSGGHRWVDMKKAGLINPANRCSIKSILHCGCIAPQ